MNYQEYINTLSFKINQLDYAKQLSLCVSVCKKLFPDYQSFSNENAWGEPSRLLNTINLIENSTSSSIDSKKIKSLMEKIYEVTPDTEDFSDGSLALHSCSAIYYTLSLILEQDAKHVITVASQYIDTIDYKIQDLGDFTDQEIDAHPEMVSAQQSLLGFCH